MARLIKEEGMIVDEWTAVMWVAVIAGRQCPGHESEMFHLPLHDYFFFSSEKLVWIREI